MINIIVNHTEISVSNHETLVEGNLNSIFLNFRFSPEWDNIARVAVFTNGESSVAVNLSSNTCAIPWEVLAAPGKLLLALRGIDDGGSYVICTENEVLGAVGKSTANGEIADAQEATPDVLDSLLADMAEIRSMGGIAGLDGKSAYDIAVEHGFFGTEAQWLASLMGCDGADGLNGHDGITPHIGANGNWYIGETDTGNPSRGANGASGTSGYTPVRGTDYWTAADIAEIQGYVDNAILNGSW